MLEEKPEDRDSDRQETKISSCHKKKKKEKEKPLTVCRRQMLQRQQEEAEQKMEKAHGFKDSEREETEKTRSKWKEEGQRADRKQRHSASVLCSHTVCIFSPQSFSNSPVVSSARNVRDYCQTNVYLSFEDRRLEPRTETEFSKAATSTMAWLPCFNR